MNLYWIIKFSLWITILEHYLGNCCTFYSPNDEYSSTDRESGNLYIPLKEDRPTNDVVLTMNVYPRKSIELRAIDRSSGDDHKYFRIHEVNGTTIQIILSQTLDDLVDNDAPQNVLKFKIQCNSAMPGNRRNHDAISVLMVTVYVEDVNDNKPVFLNSPYEIAIDETTPLGTSIFTGIKAIDRDKPNTPNSDIQYFIGQQTMDMKGGFFMLDSPHRPHVILKRSLDFDHGIRQFDLNIIARDRGLPPQQTNTTLSIFIEDIDDLPPIFTQEVYYTKVKEFFTITGKEIHKPLKIDPPVEAYDQDSLNSTLMYSIVSGNEKEAFWMHPTTGVLYLKKEIDLEAENLLENTFVLQIDVRQKNDQLKRAVSRVEIEIIDINDNQPEFEVDLYNISIVENLPNGFSVLQVNAADKDQGENSLFFYKIFKEDPKGAFSVDPQSGWMTVKNQSLLDREERPTVKLIIQTVEKVKPYNRREITSDSTVAVDITLLDSNDNSPSFEMGNLYEFKVNVNSSIGHVVGKIKAVDPDDGVNGVIKYEMKNRKETSVPFGLDPKTGLLKVSGKLTTGRIALFVEACDQPINPSETRCTLAVLTIDIVEVVDISEIKFMGAPYEFWIGSNAPIGSSIGQVRVVYHDDIIFDLLHSYSEGVPFAIEEQSGIITVIRPINSFNRNTYNFEAVATYIHSPVEHVKNQSRSMKKSLPDELGFQVDEGIVSDLNFANMYIANVTINVVSPNSKNAVFVKSSQNQFIEFRIMENSPNAIVGNLLSKNFTDMNKNLQASSSSQSTVVQKRPISRENRQIINMNSSKFRKASETKKNITAIVTTPSTIGMITRKSRTNLFNNTAQRRKAISQQYGRVVKQLPPIILKPPNNKTDEKPLSGLSKYLRSRNRFARATKNLNFFIVNDYDLKDKMYISNDGKLMTINGLDREEKESYKLSVIAEYTNGLVESAGIYQINVIVDDENDNPPHFDRSSYIGIISENCPLGTEVLLNNLIIVKDVDSGKNAEFQLSILGDGNRLFTIEKSNYVVEQRSSPFNSINNSALALFSDTVLDEYSSMVDINLHLMMLSSRDVAAANQSHYVVKFSGPSILDRERKNFYKLRLMAKDSGGLQEEAQLMIFVTDVNDNAPVFEKLAVYKQTGIEILQYSDKMEIYFVDSRPVASALEAIPISSTMRSRMSSTEETTTFPPYSSKPKMRIRPKHPLPAGSPRALYNYEDENIEDRSFKSNSPEIISKNSKYPLFSIEESLEPGITILQFTATDDDYGPNARVTYEISSEQVVALPTFKGKLNQIKKQDFFMINGVTGELKINRQLVPNLEIYVNVTAKDSAELRDVVQIAIQISDVNNHEPVFLRPFYSFDIEEGFHVSKILGSVQAVDDDFDDNANITYSIINVDESKFPFSIIPKTGLLKVSGQLDREQKSLYEFKVMARDNSRKYKQLNATVIIEINIIDINDNSPVFINYDDVMVNEIPSHRARKLNSDLHHNENIAPQNTTPVYRVTLDRNVSPRRLIKEVKATDVDYALNGMVFYNFLHSNISHLFEIDAREGFVTTTAHLDQLKELNKYEVMNLTIVASDLGNPVKSSYAVLLIALTGEKRFEPIAQSSLPKLERLKKPVAAKPILFVNQYYEIDVLENSPTPMRLIQFNTTSDDKVYVWSLVLENQNFTIRDVNEVFSIDQGILWLQKPLDREEYPTYSLKIRADVTGPRRPRTGKNMQVMYPVSDDRIENLDDNEVRVVIRVIDVNDHAPIFRDIGPIIAVIPDTVTYGYNVLKVTADDRDSGLNGDIRYSLINEPLNFFGIDALSGQVKTLGPLWRDHKRQLGFDVRATDRQGSEHGMSSIVNVVVYVLEDNKHVKFIMSGTTMELEKQVETISRSLSEATNLIVKIRMLEPHETGRDFWTNVYIYAIDPKTSTIVSMEDLQEILEQINMQELQPSLPILELTKLGVPSHLAPKLKQGSGELASIVLSITILIGGISTAICILCVRYKRRIQNAIAPVRGITSPPSRHPSQIIRQHLFLPPITGDCTESSTDPVSDDTGVTDIYAAPVLKQLIPTRKNNHITGNQNLSQRGGKREYIDIPLPKSVMNMHNHEAKCTKYNEYILPTKNNIIKHYQNQNACPCQTIAEDKHDISSNNSYEDSLKEEFATETTTTSTTRILSQRTRVFDNFDRQSNRHSFSGFQGMQGRHNKRNRSFMYPNNIR